MGKYYCGMLFNDESLYHHGILGQKWGVRRFQNLDGSYTAAGRERYGIAGEQQQKKPEKKISFIDADGKKNEMTEDEYLKYKNKILTDMRRSTEKEDHGEQGNNKSLGTFAVKVALDALNLNPIGAVEDAYILGKAVSGKVKSNKYNKERDKNPIDEKTGVHLKTKELSEKEDLKRINPEVSDFNTNSKSNCVLCTTAYELRRRGYDVEAKKASVGYTPGDIKRLFPKAKIQSFMSDTVEVDKDRRKKASFGMNTDYAKDIVQKLEKQPNGARGNLFVVWGNMGAGHSMIYEIKDGKMIVMDGQINKVYNDPVKILKRCTDVRAIRTDNLELNPKLVKEFVK